MQIVTRPDVRSADRNAWLETSGPEPILHLQSRSGEIAYRSSTRAVLRRVGSGSWVCVLTNVASSAIESDPRQNITPWRWELELQTRVKSTRIRPLFTFLAVPEKGVTK